MLGRLQILLKPRQKEQECGRGWTAVSSSTRPRDLSTDLRQMPASSKNLSLKIFWTLSKTKNSIGSSQSPFGKF